MFRFALVALLALFAAEAVACDRDFRGFNDCRNSRNFRGDDVVIERETVIRRGLLGRQKSRTTTTRSFR